MIQFVQMTLTPIVRQYEQEMNRKLLNKKNGKKAITLNSTLEGC